MNIELSTIRQAQAGVQSAQTEIFNIFFRPLITRGVRHFSLNQEAEDLAMIALTKAFEAMKKTKFASSKQFTNWIFRIHQNSAFDHGRKKLRRITIVFSGELTPDSHPDALVVSKKAEVEAQHELASTLETLREGQTPENVNILLQYASGISDRELGETFNLSVGTVRSRVRRTRKRLQASLNS